MNRDETINLLTAIAAYDERKPSAAMVMAWSEAATRSRWTFPEALEAVHEHYRAGSERLMPGHITERVRAARQDTAMRETGRQQIVPPPRQALEASEEWLMSRSHDGRPVASEDTRARVMAELAKVMKQRTSSAPHPPGYGADTHRAALRVPCPWCRANPYSDCTRPGIGGPRRRATPHPSRVDAARVAQ